MEHNPSASDSSKSTKESSTKESYVEETQHQMEPYIKLLTQKAIQTEFAEIEKRMASDREELNKRFEQKLDQKLAALVIALKGTPRTDRGDYHVTPPVHDYHENMDEFEVDDETSQTDGRKWKDPPPEVQLPSEGNKRQREDDELSVGN